MPVSAGAGALLAILLLALWMAGVAMVVWTHRRELSRAWREPVWRRPVLIIESDDWGAGPAAQATALRAIAQVLARHRDATGRMPVMSLALVLAVPDGSAMRNDGGYRRVELDDAQFAPIVDALRTARDRGVFALQLHGHEHYWPPELVASRDEAVADWLRSDVPAVTEPLPPPLQSRWVDASRLPSSPHADADLRAAVADEVGAYERIVGERPAVVVQPTFVWTRAVERAWSSCGIGFVVTPGWRYPMRDGQGQPASAEGPIVNGDRDEGITHLARCDYFEPVRGRDARHALGVLERCAVEGRLCILENHRDNFVSDPEAGRRSLGELDELMREATAGHSELRSLSTQEAGVVLRERDPRWLIARRHERLPFVWRRLAGTGRLWKLLTASGATLLGHAAVRLLAVPPLHPPPKGGHKPRH